MKTDLANTTNSTIHIEIGVTYTKRGKPFRKFFHLSGFETRELAQSYANWLNQMLHDFIINTQQNITEHVWIVRPIIITATQTPVTKASADDFNLHPCNMFICIITAIAGAFNIEINPAYITPLLHLTFNCAEPRPITTDACE